MTANEFSEKIVQTAWDVIRTEYKDECIELLAPELVGTSDEEMREKMDDFKHAIVSYVVALTFGLHHDLLDYFLQLRANDRQSV